MNQERFFKLAEVQAMFSTSRSTVWRWHAERGLRVVKIGGVTRIREGDLQAFLKRHESGVKCEELPQVQVDRGHSP